MTARDWRASYIVCEHVAADENVETRREVFRVCCVSCAEVGFLTAPLTPSEPRTDGLNVRSLVPAHVRAKAGVVDRRTRRLRFTPSGETLCGGECTSYDMNRADAARSARDPKWRARMCAACLAAMEAGK